MKRGAIGRERTGFSGTILITPDEIIERTWRLGIFLLRNTFFTLLTSLDHILKMKMGNGFKGTATRGVLKDEP
jgi:hypothetical protein